MYQLLKSIHQYYVPEINTDADAIVSEIQSLRNKTGNTIYCFWNGIGCSQNTTFNTISCCLRCYPCLRVDTIWIQHEIP